MSELEKILDELESLAKQGTITIKEYDDHIEALEYGKLEELRLNNYSAKLLLNYIQQKENIIKEVREEVIKYKEILETGAEQNVLYIYLDSPIQKSERFLEILDKESQV